MSTEIHITQGAAKAQKYESLLPQLVSLVQGETDFIANVSNIMAALKSTHSFLWIGCYFIQENELVLGPFQGPVACTRIAKGKGVCGTSWAKNETIVVPDVEQFPGHIACSSRSQSEIVVPIHNHKHQLIGVLDADSDLLNYFDETDRQNLELIASLIGKLGRVEA